MRNVKLGRRMMMKVRRRRREMSMLSEKTMKVTSRKTKIGRGGRLKKEEDEE